MSGFNVGRKNKTRLIDRRQFFLTASKGLIAIGIVGRLFSLQISENKKYTSLSDKNRIREWKLAPKRGTIEDYFGNLIADNNQIFQLFLVPEDMVNFNSLFFRLKKIINLSDKRMEEIKKKIDNSKPWEPIIISNNLNWSEFSRLNLFLHELPGSKPVVSIARYYPMNEIFSHLVGYVSDASIKDLAENKKIRDVFVPGFKVGKNGLEKLLNNQLIGGAGYQRYEVNAYGKKIKEIEYVEGKVGKNFKTTLDAEVQSLSYDLIKEHSASICIMDIYSGEVISMASSPSFNPNFFVHGITKKNWDLLIQNENKPLMNKCIAGLYPPGSTIKPLVALSALEFDVINPNLKVKCKGNIELHGSKYHCWREKGHGYIGLREAIKQSCDIYFYEVSRLLGIDRLSMTTKKFGFGKKIFKFLDEEKEGIMPSTKWKKDKLGKNWYLGETLISGIGQGYIQTTPLQLCLMMAQIANGGYAIQPKLIVKKEDSVNSFLDSFPFNGNMSEDKVLFRNQENIKFVQEALFGATNEPRGTSFSSRNIEKKYMFAGKTGTSQVRKITEREREEKIKNEDLPYKQRDHALFTAFAPYDDPRYAISVVVEHGGGGGKVAAPIAKKIIRKVIDRHSLRVSQNNNILKEV